MSSGLVIRFSQKKKLSTLSCLDNTSNSSKHDEKLEKVSKNEKLEKVSKNEETEKNKSEQYNHSEIKLSINKKRKYKEHIDGTLDIIQDEKYDFQTKKQKKIIIDESYNDVIEYERKKFHITVIGDENHFVESEEVVQGINLLDYLEKFRYEKEYDLKEVFDVCLKIAVGMTFLQNQEFAHTDLEPRNIIVSHDKKPNITIIDTSRTTDLFGQDYYVETRFNPKTHFIYMAPECLEYKSFY